MASSKAAVGGALEAMSIWSILGGRRPLPPDVAARRMAPRRAAKRRATMAVSVKVITDGPLMVKGEGGVKGSPPRPREPQRDPEGGHSNQCDEVRRARLAQHTAHERTQEDRPVHAHAIDPGAPAEPREVGVLADHAERQHPPRHAEPEERGPEPHHGE